MELFIPKETAAGERRVALVPASVKKLLHGTSSGFQIVFEPGAGAQAGYPDGAYQDAGAAPAADPSAAWSTADAVVCCSAPPAGLAAQLKPNALLLGMLDPLGAPGLLKTLAEQGVTGFAFESVPRLTRAQFMDALSSMSTVAGYRAALIAAQASPRFFPMLTTAAGVVPPAKALVLGAGVAGLQAIATCRRLGAVVSAYDVRTAASEQVQSLGASFVELGKAPTDAETSGGYARAQSDDEQSQQRRMLQPHAAAADVVITTALIPGRPAPRLLDDQTLQAMRPGSVVVDLAAETGGNCEWSVPGETVQRHGVSVIGPTHLPSSLPHDASAMYSKNVEAVLSLLCPAGALRVDLTDAVLAGAVVVHRGEVLDAQARAALCMPPMAPAQELSPEPSPDPHSAPAPSAAEGGTA